jgi:hypothetical protein
MRKSFLAIAATAALSFFAGSVLAHHSADVYFDLGTTYVLRGVISSFAFQNPHSYAFMDVTTCKTDKWAVEMESPPALSRKGFTRTVLQKGMPITVVGSPAKFQSSTTLPELSEAWNAKHFVLGGCITLPDGKKIESENGPRCDRPKPDIVIGQEAK